MAAIAAVDLAGRVRAARRLHELPQPGAARQAGRDDRRDQRRPVHPRPRRRLERDRVPRLRLPVRPPRRPLRGGVHDHPDAPARRRDRLRRALLPGARLRAAAARRPARRAAAADRLERAADAADRRCPTPTPGTPGTRTSATRRRASRRCATSSTRRAATSGATRPTIERTVAVLVRLPGGTGPAPGRRDARPRSRRSTGRPGRDRRRRSAPTPARASRTSSSSSTRSRSPSIQAVATVLAELDRG